MNDDTRSPHRRPPRPRPRGGGRPRSGPDGGGRRRQAPRPVYRGRRNNYATGGYSSIFAGPFPREGDETDEGWNLADLQARILEELRELGSELGVEGADELEHSDLVLKLLDGVPPAP